MKYIIGWLLILIGFLVWLFARKRKAGPIYVTRREFDVEVERIRRELKRDLGLDSEGLLTKGFTLTKGFGMVFATMEILNRRLFGPRIEKEP